MALITKMHRCAFCGSSEVTVSENGTYTCHMNRGAAAALPPSEPDHLVQGESSPVLILQPRAAMVYLLRR